MAQSRATLRQNRRMLFGHTFHFSFPQTPTSESEFDAKGRTETAQLETLVNCLIELKNPRIAQLGKNVNPRILFDAVFIDKKPVLNQVSMCW